MIVKTPTIAALAVIVSVSAYIGGYASRHSDASPGMQVPVSVRVPIDVGTILGASVRISQSVDEQLVECTDATNRERRSALLRMIGCSPIN
jgi:hypothetical protein